MYSVIFYIVYFVIIDIFTVITLCDNFVIFIMHYLHNRNLLASLVLIGFFTWRVCIIGIQIAYLIFCIL